MVRRGHELLGVVTSDYGQHFHKSGADLSAFFTTPGLVRSSLALGSEAMRVCASSGKGVGMEFLHSSHFPQLRAQALSVCPAGHPGWEFCAQPLGVSVR